MKSYPPRTHNKKNRIKRSGFPAMVLHSPIYQAPNPMKKGDVRVLSFFNIPKELLLDAKKS